jgi:hypothetical protein
MTAPVLLATDLDRTLIYSASAAGAMDGDAVTVERLDGRPLSFMTATAAGQLAELARAHVVVPVTTRTPAQFARVRLPGPPARYAVAANGGVLLVDGEPDPAWTLTMRKALRPVAPLEAAVATLGAVCDPAWASPIRTAVDLFCYVVVDRLTLPDDVAHRLRSWAGPAGWQVSLQGRKLYLVPGPLTKSAAVAEVARRAGTERLLAAGDSLLDIDLLAAADRGVHPGHGEIAESGWSAPTVDALTSTGLRAGEEITAWFATFVASEPVG